MQAHYHQWRGHSSRVGRMLFLASDSFLITTGRHDICILQWAVEPQLPLMDEEDEYGTDEDVRHMEDSYEPLESESDHDYQDDDNDYAFSQNAASNAGKPPAQTLIRNNRYSNATGVVPLEMPPAKGQLSDRNHDSKQVALERQNRTTERNPRFPLPAQKNKSRTGSYAEMFNKHKGIWNSDQEIASHQQSQLPDMGLWPEDEHPQQLKEQIGGGGARGRNHRPRRGGEKKQERRPMR